MATQTTLDLAISKELAYYLTMVELNDYLPINSGHSSAKESTMISTLGSPLMPLTTSDQPSKASPLVKKLSKTAKVSQHVVVTAIIPALESLNAALQKVFMQEQDDGHDLESILSTDGMLVVRLRNPTSGAASSRISNHSWGTAIDFKIIGHTSPGNTGHQIPRFIGVMLKSFNEEGWYSGIGFHDTMHFEVSDGSIQKWSSEGRFNLANA